jgi:IS30 family transposase
MPIGYRHLTYELRCQIYAFLKSGMSQNQIAKQLKLTQSTISREIQRNSGKKGYRYKQAHEKAVSRRYKASVARKKMTPDLTFFIEQKICEQQWSPEQISGYLKKNMNTEISHESIYQYILRTPYLRKYLRRGGKKYNKRSSKLAGRGLIPNRVDIKERPAIVANKERVGDFEIDTIIGANHQGAIVNITERKTMLTRLKLISKKTSEQTANATIQLLNSIKKHVHTITSDNGKEFANHEMIAQELEAQIFFATPYHSWERGLNENMNGLVRQYFPKKFDFSKITEEALRNVEYLLNTRPRKSLNFQTPYEVFYQLTGINVAYALRG